MTNRRPGKPHKWAAIERATNAHDPVQERTSRSLPSPLLPIGRPLRPGARWAAAARRLDPWPPPARGSDQRPDEDGKPPLHRGRERVIRSPNSCCHYTGGIVLAGMFMTFRDDFRFDAIEQWPEPGPVHFPVPSLGASPTGIAPVWRRWRARCRSCRPGPRR